MGQSEKVYLVDDDPAIRDALGLFLESEGYNVLQLAAARDLLNAVSDTDRAVVVLDQYLGDMSGLELQAELNGLGIEWPLIFISGRGNIGLSVRAMKAGAINFLEKPVSNEDLLGSVESAFAIMDELKEANQLRQLARETCSRLSAREHEVMALVVSGMSNSKIAEHLGLSIRTIEVHRANIHKKTGADTLAELVRLADLCLLSIPNDPA